MSKDQTPTHDNVVQHLQDLAMRALRRYDMPAGLTARLVNISENATYRIDDPSTGTKWALRIHRDGYHSRTAIASEIAWLSALMRDGAATTPSPVAGRDGDVIQTVAGDDVVSSRNVVLFSWEPGDEPTDNDVAGFEQLGETAARMHAHAKFWQRPPWFQRHSWDFETSLGDEPHWGRWRDGLGMTDEIRSVFAETVALIGRRLDRFGKGRDRFGLIHGDMRLANLLMDQGVVKVIDFDDCGFSWYLYDCATTVSFFEEKPEVPELIKAWVRGYRRVGVLSQDDEAEIDTFVMLRRILLVAWIGSHSETKLAQSMGVAYTQGTVPLCQAYLTRFGESAKPAQSQSNFVKPSLWQRVFG